MIIPKKQFLKWIWVISSLFPSYLGIGQLQRSRNQIEIFNEYKPEIYQINLANKSYLYFNAKTKDSLEFPIIFKNFNLEDFPNLFKINAIQKAENEFWITITGTGQTYLFDHAKHTLIRVDKTYYRGFNFLAIQFLHKDTLFSFGGMGFWHSHNVPIFFDKPNFGWELYSIQNKGPARFSSRIGGFSKKLNKIITVELPEIYENQDSKNSKVYQFDMRTKKWKELGKLNTLPKAFWDHEAIETHWIEPFFFPNNYHNYFIDPLENKIYVANKYLSFFSKSDKLFSRGNYLYSFFRSDRKDLGWQLDSISIHTLRKNSTVIGTFYTPITRWDNIDWQLILITLLIIMMILLSIRYDSLRKKMTQIESTNKVQLPDFGENFISYILNHPNNYCSTNDLNDLLGVGNRTLDSQRQSRSKFIQQMNAYFLQKYGIEQGISRVNSSYDKRFVVYKPSEALMDRLLEEK